MWTIFTCNLFFCKVNHEPISPQRDFNWGPGNITKINQTDLKIFFRFWTQKCHFFDWWTCNVWLQIANQIEITQIVTQITINSFTSFEISTHYSFFSSSSGYKMKIILGYLFILGLAHGSIIEENNDRHKSMIFVIVC